jgi:hypothetical protein
MSKVYKSTRKNFIKPQSYINIHKTEIYPYDKKKDPVVFANVYLELDEQIRAVNELTDEDKEILSRYIHPRTKFYLKLNEFLQNSDDEEYINDYVSNFESKEQAYDYIHKLDAIFQKIPPISKPFYVYRCNKSGMKYNNIFTQASYTSTTFDVNYALEYCTQNETTENTDYTTTIIPSHNKGQIIRIFIPRGYRVIPLIKLPQFGFHFNEYEILLPRDCKFIKYKSKDNTQVVMTYLTKDVKQIGKSRSNKLDTFIQKTVFRNVNLESYALVSNEETEILNPTPKSFFSFFKGGLKQKTKKRKNKNNK